MRCIVLFHLLLLFGMYSAQNYKNLALRGEATQAHPYFGADKYGSATSAIDGSRNNLFLDGSCSHTAEMSNPWWRVDLLDSYVITQIIVTNRGDCCEERINGAEIRIGNSNQSNGVENPLAATISSMPRGASQTINITGGMEGRYVTVVIPGSKKILTLCEVEVYGHFVPSKNLALRGKATESSHYRGELGGFVDAYKAIDGNRNPNLRKGSCTHTERESNPWWRVDLLDSYVITQVIVTNRGDCGEERINGANIHIGNSLQNNGVENPRAAIISSIPSGTSQVINIPGHMEGRYVTIVIPGSDQVLTLCEVEVYGYRAPTGENLALLGKATQSSQYDIGDASKAIDGNRRNRYTQASCSHTSNDLSPWWRLDMLKTRKVFSIKVVNRDSFEERLSGAEIRIGDSLDNNGNNNPRCAVITVSLGKSLYEFACNGMEGRYVNIVIPGRSEYLTLCEVEVYGSTLE
ncbi:PREDICTED: uncharacterized protein LOC106926467 [Poecilia mexicana]|nr:PREDICTED: uncharacterized protein LOC106926467 [Poecilia mexicana]